MMRCPTCQSEVDELCVEAACLQRSTIWLTGMPCSGKTMLAKALVERLQARGFRVKHLDGDDVRNGLCDGLGFTPNGRHENLRRIGHVAKMFNEAGVLLIASFVSPSEEYRWMLRGILEDFRLVHVDCSAEECERRDVKGMWARARKGEILGFTGLDADFEKPRKVDVVVNTEAMSVEECVDILMKELTNDNGDEQSSAGS